MGNRSFSLTEAERSIYEWQLPVTGFGDAGQEKLKGSSVLISRCGGVGGVVAYELAAAGVGRLVLAHSGEIKAGDLNRQILMTHGAIGQSRVHCAAERLRELNPRVAIQPVAENVSAANVDRLMEGVDLVVDCAPLFDERYAMNRAAVCRGKPMIECAVYELEAHLTTFIPRATGCLRCLYPEPSTEWQRRFPVFGAVAAAVGGMAAMEAIKVLAGFGKPLAGDLLTFDLRDVSMRRFPIARNPACLDCGSVPATGASS